MVRVDGAASEWDPDDPPRTELTADIGDRIGKTFRTRTRVRQGDLRSGRPVVTFDTLDDAAQLAAGTEYGLSLGILSRDLAKGMALAEWISSGLVHINDQTVNDEAVRRSAGSAPQARAPATEAPEPT